jgi:oligoendopeptidase F
MLIPERLPQYFIDNEFDPSLYENFKPYFETLLSATYSTVEEFIEWIDKLQEFQRVASTEMAWAYINKSRDTSNADYRKRYELFVNEIIPKLSPLWMALNKKLLESEFLPELQGTYYERYCTLVKNSLALYNEINIPLFVKVSQKTDEFSRIVASRNLFYDGKEQTIPQLSLYLKSDDRAVREEVWKLITEQSLEEYEQLDEIFSELVSLRDEIAINAGEKNFRDYQFKSFDRLEYTAEDCFVFHKAIEDYVLPLENKILENRKQILGVDELRPWDLSVDIYGTSSLQPYQKTEELIDGCIRIFNRLHPGLGEYLSIMKEVGHLDLESRKAKEMGGYNSPLYDRHIPFIFMNAVGLQRDVVTLLHEVGHAIHTFVTKEQSIVAYKSFPKEVAEFASMSMELLTMDFWDEFYKTEEDLQQAKRQQLERVIELLPRIAKVDAFQHWVYENPNHTSEERANQWIELSERFSKGAPISRDGITEYRHVGWQFQHIFRSPFYYIDYGIAQIGAVQMWANYKKNPQATIQAYLEALKLGGSKNMKEVYETAGIKFDLTPEFLKELMEFVSEELKALS